MGAKRGLNLTPQNVHHLSSRRYLAWEFVKCDFRKVTLKVLDEIDILMACSFSLGQLQRRGLWYLHEDRIRACCTILWFQPPVKNLVPLS